MLDFSLDELIKGALLLGILIIILKVLFSDTFKVSKDGYSIEVNNFKDNIHTTPIKNTNKIKSIHKVWTALLNLDSFLQNEWREQLYDAVSIDASEWHIVHDTADILNQNAAEIPIELFEPSNKLISIELANNINKLLDLLREYIKARTENNSQNISFILKNIEIQLNKVILDYRNGILNLKPIYDRYLDKSIPKD